MYALGKPGTADFVVRVRRQGGTWKWIGYGGCRPWVVVDGLEATSWRLASKTLDPGTRKVSISFITGECARFERAEVTTTASAVTITVFLRTIPTDAARRRLRRRRLHEPAGGRAHRAARPAGAAGRRHRAGRDGPAQVTCWRFPRCPAVREGRAAGHRPGSGDRETHRRSDSTITGCLLAGKGVRGLVTVVSASSAATRDGGASFISMLRALSPRRRLLVVAVALVTVAGGLAVVALRLAGGPDGGGAGTATTVTPVVLVPGYGGAPASLATLERRLRTPLRPVVVADLPDRGTGEIDASVRALGRTVEATGARAVDLVGYSAGGIVVRAWLRQDGNAARARHVVLLGSPNHGTELAALAGTVDASLCVDTCADLATGSRFLARLNAGDETPPGPDYTSVWTQRDQVVTPPASARLRGAVNVRVQDVCADASFGHSGLVRDPLALGLVVRTVDGGLPATPRPADCLPLRALGALAPP
jgi:triacylglycerol esterase/lipase EstA (alpha/beta hydrolase family)